MPIDQNRVRDVFLSASEKPASERAAYLDHVCGDDFEFRAAVERLLAAFGSPHSLVKSPAEPLPLTHPHTPQPDSGTVLAGRYKLLEQIGEGGMGAVWMAQQTEPIKRTVAVKLIKPGMDSRTVLARFEAERQALALMDHTNIARVLDAGVSNDGRPFFVMELVRGVPITQFCDARRLNLRERLELFVPVCQAIQHAHQKGIIHRDIKPSNVLIATFDDRPVPKIIDFGVAKATSQPLTELTLHTGFGTVIGTPQYMSPEQATFNNLDIDTRADIYSLGVLLYELLAGSPPFTRKELAKAGVLEMLRVVREEEPPRPSTRLSTADTLASLAASRGTEPRKLTVLLRNELDWIVMKALEKDRTRRYETANGFAADVQRYLTGEPVHAVPPSVGYRLSKFILKHRGSVVTSAAFVGLLLASVAVSGWLAVTADNRRLDADANFRKAEENAELYAQTALVSEQNRLDAELYSTSLQIDLELAEFRNDPRVALLRLARDLKQMPTDREKRYGNFPDKFSTYAKAINDFLEKQGELREFVKAAIVTRAQEFAPLLPPIADDGPKVQFELSPDCQTILTLGPDRMARLWDTRTARPIAVLRSGKEQVFNCGFSPDGKTVFTDDDSSVARFWEAPSGRFLSKTEHRPTRYPISSQVPGKLESQEETITVPVAPSGSQNLGSRPDARKLAVQIKNNRLMTCGYVNPVAKEKLMDRSGPVELWDITSGQLVARLDVPNHIKCQDFQFLGGARWITANESHSSFLVFSSEDGKLLARLKFTNDPGFNDIIFASPSGRWIGVVCESKNGTGQTIHLWETSSWREYTTPISTPWHPNHARFLTEEEIAVYDFDNVTPRANEFETKWNASIYKINRAEPILRIGKLASDCLELKDGLAHAGDGRIYDTANWNLLVPPPGRKFHSNLSRFSPDGRFVRAIVNEESVLIDTRTDKCIPNWKGWRDSIAPLGNLPGFGLVALVTEPKVRVRRIGFNATTTTTTWDGNVIRLLPSALLDLSPQVLELWVQISLRGELGPDGSFVNLDEASWERKRQELVGLLAPRSDQQLLGHLAPDRFRWLETEFDLVSNDTDRLRIARELVIRAEATGNRKMAEIWRSNIASLDPREAPPPREVKK